MKKRGFTLVEIMIVVAIIALLAAIAIPNLVNMRLKNNEAAAQEAMKVIVRAETDYRTANGSYATLAQLGIPVKGQGYIDVILAGGVKNGYNIVTSDIAGETFCAVAAPVTPNVTGVRSFCVTEDGVVRVQAAGGAIADRAACIALPATAP